MKNYYDKNKKLIKLIDLRKEFTIFKNKEDNKWTYEINNDVFKQAIKDSYKAMINFLNKKSKFPKYKTRNSKKSFYNDSGYSLFSLTKYKVRLTKIGWINLCEVNKIPILSNNYDYNNIRIKYDGIYWYLTLSIKIDKLPCNHVINKSNILSNLNNNSSINIGIDLGLKTYTTIAIKDNNKNNEYEIIKFKSNKKLFKKLEKKKSKILRKLQHKRDYYKKSKMYLYNKDKSNNKELNKNEKRQKRKVGENSATFKPNYSMRYYKDLKSLNKVSHRMTNIQVDLIYKIINFLVSLFPNTITIEDLKVKNLLKNRKVAKWISYNQFYTFKELLKYKCELYGINLVIADKFFPSTQKCSRCGNIKYGKNKLSLKDRIYKCDICDYIEDRDNNAAINLLEYKVS